MRRFRYESSWAAGGGWGRGYRRLRAATTDHGAVEVGGGMVVRAANVTAGAVGAEGLAAAEAGGCCRCVVVGAVKPAERGCCAAGTTEVARLAGARGCCVVGATKVARLAGARGCCAAGATKIAGLAGVGCWAESPDM